MASGKATSFTCWLVRELPLLRSLVGTRASQCSWSVRFEEPMVNHSLVIKDPMEHAFLTPIASGNPDVSIRFTVGTRFDRYVIGRCVVLH